MNDYRFILLFCTVAALDAGTSEFVWLRDLNNDAHKRHLDLGLSEELRFQLNRGKKSINLHLKENPHIRADTDMYVVKEMPDGTKSAMKEPVTGNIESKYYHDIDNSGVFTVRCVKRAKRPCARTLEGSLMIGDNYFHMAPVSDLINEDILYMNREYHDTPHVIREEIANRGDFRLTNDTIKLSDAEEEAVRKSLFVNLWRSLDNLNVEESDLDKSKPVTKVFGVELLVVVDPPVWQKQLYEGLEFKWKQRPLYNLDNGQRVTPLKPLDKPKLVDIKGSQLIYWQQEVSNGTIEFLSKLDGRFYALANEDTQNAMNRVREYVSQVINGVALTYKSIKESSFSIGITLKAITVLKKQADGPYNNAKLFQKNGMWSIDDYNYLVDFRDWVVNTPGMPLRSDFDHAMMLTGYNMISSSGIAYFSSVCSQSSVSVVTQADYISTMMRASHQLAHSLGAEHDLEAGCQKGNIMGMNLPGLVNEYSHKAWEFSKCSIDDFAKTLAQKSCVKDEATFYNKEDYDNYNKLYPGQIYSEEEQCKISFGQDSRICGIPKPDKICVSLFCYNPLNGYCNSQIAADGTQCGTGNMWCIDGKCVSKQPMK